MTLSRFLKVLRKLLEPSLSFQLFGASTPEGRFSQDRQFTFFSSQFSYLSKQTFHRLMPNLFFMKHFFSFGMCGENEDFDGNSYSPTAYNSNFLLYRKCTLVMVIGSLCHQPVLLTRLCWWVWLCRYKICQSNRQIHKDTNVWRTNTFTIQIKILMWNWTHTFKIQYIKNAISRKQEIQHKTVMMRPLM